MRSSDRNQEQDSVTVYSEMQRTFAKHAKILQIDVDPAEINKNIHDRCLQ